MPTNSTDILNSGRLGAYHPNQFLITLETLTPFFQVNNDGSVESNQRGHLLTYMHEYWHYLQNISTISGFMCFVLMQELVALFSNTLDVGSDGKIYCKGSAASEPDIQQQFREIIVMFNALRGEKKPQNLWRSPVKEWVIAGISKKEIPITWKGEQQQRYQLQIDLCVTHVDGIVNNSAQLFLAADAIQESVAYLVEKLICTKDRTLCKGTDVPVFPYTVLERVFEHIVNINDEPLDVIASIGTLSLLSGHPASALYDFLVDYRDCRQGGLVPITALNSIINRARPMIFATIESALGRDIDSVGSIHKGRGLAEVGSKHIADLMKNAFKRRKEFLLFDLEFSSKTTQRKMVRAINKLLAAFPPCDILQKQQGEDHEIMRDFLGTSHSPEAQKGFYYSDGVRTLHSQIHFMDQHLRTMGFAATDQLDRDGEARCPFYTACQLPPRKSDASICELAPWEHWVRGPSTVCWYGSGVASTAGLVKIANRI